MNARRVAWWLYRLPRMLMILFIRGWRTVLSPLYGQTCKYYPSCSSYGLAAVERHGALRGGAMTGWRILRCNPFSHGGVDEVPPTQYRLALTRWLAPDRMPTGQHSPAVPLPTDLTHRCDELRDLPLQSAYRRSA